MTRWLAGACLIVMLAGCAERLTTPPPGADAVVRTYPAHDRKIRVVRGDLPPGTRFEVLGKVKAIETFYGPQSQAEISMAGLARAIGADAVIDEKAWHAPRPLAPYGGVPHAEGLAVKILNPESTNLDNVPGWWY